MKYFRFIKNQAGAVEYWKKSQFDLTDIVLSLTDNCIMEGLQFYNLFQNEDFLKSMNIFKFNFKLVKEQLGISGDYVERKGDVYSKEFNPTRIKGVLTLDKQTMQEKAKIIYNEIELEIAELSKILENV